MDWWQVTVETHGDDPTLVDDTAIALFVDALAAHSGVVTGGPGYTEYGATVSVQAAGPAEAFSAACAAVTGAATRATLPTWPVVRAQAIREDALDRELLDGATTCR